MSNDWVFKDNLICIYNYINVHRRADPRLKFISIEEVNKLVNIYAVENRISIKESAEQVKRFARRTGELELLKYLRTISKGWKSCRNNLEKQKTYS